MTKTKLLRIVLLIGALFNISAAFMLAFPKTIGKFAELPEPGSIFYNLLLAVLVALFGFVYGWLALQKQIYRPLIAIAGIGKAGVFLASLYCWSINAITFNGLVVACGDLLFALIFFWWLFAVPANSTEA